MPITVFPSSMTDLDVRPVARQFSEMGSAGDWQVFNNAGAGISQIFTLAGIEDTERIGIFSSDTGSTSTAWGGIGHNTPGSVSFGVYQFRFSAIIKIPILSTALETFQIIVGYWDRRNTATPTDGVYFAYTHGTFAGDWSCEVYNNGATLGAVDSNVAATTNWVRLEILVTPSGTAQFFINGTLVSTQTGVGTGTARATQAGSWIKKSVGTTPRSIYVDSMLLEMDANR